MAIRPDVLVWMDLEMSGLDAEREKILEVAVLVTDAQLEIVAEGPELVIHQSEAVLSGMDSWNLEHHGGSGLIDRVRSSTITEGEAESEVLSFLKEHCAEKSAPLAGNSIHQDRRFIRRSMPALDAFLHYRQVDVSTLKELARRWYPDAFSKAPPKKETHRALDDIRESIDELRYYRETIFRR